MKYIVDSMQIPKDLKRELLIVWGYPKETDAMYRLTLYISKECGHLTWDRFIIFVSFHLGLLRGLSRPQSGGVVTPDSFIEAVEEWNPISSWEKSLPEKEKVRNTSP